MSHTSFSPPDVEMGSSPLLLKTAIGSVKWTIAVVALAIIGTTTLIASNSSFALLTATKTRFAPTIKPHQMKTSAQSNFLLASERSDDLIFDTNVPARQHGGMSFVPIWAFPLGICALATAFLLGIGKAASIATGAATSAKDVQALRLQCGAGMMDCKNALEQNGGDFQQAAEWLRKKGITSADKKTSRIAAEGVIGQYIHMGSRIGVLIEVNCETDFVARGEVFKSLVENLAMQVAACQNVTIIDTNDADPVWLAKECEIEMGKEDLKSKPQQIREKIVEGRVQKRVKEIALLEQPFIRDQDKTVSEVVKEAIAAVGEKIKVRRFAKFVLGEGLEKRSSNFAADVAAQAEIAAKKVTEANPTEELQASPAETDAMQVSAKTVSELRRKSAAGILDCKKALEATNGDMDAAAEWLRKKGLVSAHKKASRIAAEGMVTSYIHTGNRLGVLLELNCETDFVARGDAFNQLAADLAMQVAACDVLVVAAEDVDPSWLAKEREIEMGKEDLKSKPEQIRAKIVEGRVQKRVKEVALLEQPFIKDQDKTVKEVLKAAISTIGENIKIRRFERFVLGEGLEKRSNNFAEEVAATTGKV